MEYEECSAERYIAPAAHFKIVDRPNKKGCEETVLPSDVKKKYMAILSHEQAVARSVAATVIRPKPLSVWEVLIPIIFILMFMKSREEREVFVQNLTFTKRMALDAALQITRDQRSIEEVLTMIEKQTEELVTTAGGIYSDQIRREQLKEVRLLIDHYCRLLNADGKEYKTLAVGAYPTFDSYCRFFKQLEEAEARVTAAARRTLGSRTDTGTLARIENAVKRVRVKKAEEIYSAG